jgi:hypothetical protein
MGPGGDLSGPTTVLKVIDSAQALDLLKCGFIQYLHFRYVHTAGIIGTIMLWHDLISIFSKLWRDKIDLFHILVSQSNINGLIIKVVSGCFILPLLCYRWTLLGSQLPWYALVVAESVRT